MTQDEEQAEGPSHHETGTATRNVEEASSMERAAVTCEEKRTTLSRRETCMVEERAPPA